MNPHARFAKTDKGQDEIRNRAHRLPPRQRALLVMVDGSKTAAELLETATGLGGGPELLEALVKDGFIEEARSETGAALAPAKRAPAAAPAAPEASPKVYAAKAAMRRYIKVAAVEMRALNSLVDEVRKAEDVERVLGELQSRFEANGFGEAFANLQSELSEVLKDAGT